MFPVSCLAVFNRFLFFLVRMFGRKALARSTSSRLQGFPVYFRVLSCACVNPKYVRRDDVSCCAPASTPPIVRLTENRQTRNQRKKQLPVPARAANFPAPLVFREACQRPDTPEDAVTAAPWFSSGERRAATGELTEPRMLTNHDVVVVLLLFIRKLFVYSRVTPHLRVFTDSRPGRS